MTLGAFFLFCLATAGMTHIIIESSLLEPAREYLRGRLPPKIFSILECYQCCGTWCGFLCGFILLSYNPFVVLACGCAGSFVSVLTATYLEYLTAKSVIDTHGS